MVGRLERSLYLPFPGGGQQGMLIFNIPDAKALCTGRCRRRPPPSPELSLDLTAFSPLIDTIDTTAMGHHVSFVS